MTRITTLLLANVLTFMIAVGSVGIIGKAQAETLGVPIDQAYVNRDYAKLALVHQWNRKDDYVTPTALLRAAVMARNGAPREEIIKAITTLREQHDANLRAGLRRDWQVSEDYKTMIRHAGGLAGILVGTYTKIAPLEDVIDLVSDLGIMTYEHLARDKKVIAASEALGVMYQNVAGAENNIAELVARTWTESEVFRDVYSEQFEPVLRIRPSDSVEAINGKLPDLLLQDNVTTILSILSRRVPITEQNVTDIKDEVRLILTNIRQTESAEGAQKMTEFEKRRDRIRRDGLRSGAFLASTALGYVDPTMGKHFHALSSAAFQIHDTIEAFRTATEVHKDLTGSASLTLTGNFVGAALTLVGTFSASGPTPEQLILEQIAKLRKDLQNVRLEMHDRFGIVERKISIMYVNLDRGIHDLELELRKHDRKLDHIIMTLGDVRNQISASTELLYDRTVVLENLIARLEIGECVKWKRGVNIPIPAEKFGECLFAFQALFSPVYLESRQLSAVEAELSGNLVEWLREKPNELASTSANKLDELVQHNLPDVMPGPSDWQSIATLYLNFLDDWPEHMRIVEKNGLDLQALTTGGQTVEGMREVARRELLSFSMGETKNAVEKLLDRVANRRSALDAAITDRKREYYEDEFEEFVPIMEPIADSQECAFHGGLHGGFEGIGYIADLPGNIETVLPTFVKRSLFVGIGKVEYCLEMYYKRGRSKRGSIDKERRSVLVASIEQDVTLLEGLMTRASDRTSGVGGFLFADTEGIYYFREGGPYAVLLKVDYVLDSLECSSRENSSGRVRIFELSAVDPTKTIRGTGYHGSNEPQTYAVAPRRIWDAEWRDRFLAEAVLKKSKGSEECLATHLGPKVKERWDRNESDWVANKIVDANDPGNEILRDLDEETEIDYALLSHWLWSAFGDAADEDPLLARLIVGTASGPTLISSIAETVVQRDTLVSEAPGRYSNGVNDLREVLRSEEMVAGFAKSKDNFDVTELLQRIDALGL